MRLAKLPAFALVGIAAIGGTVWLCRSPHAEATKHARQASAVDSGAPRANLTMREMMDRLGRVFTADAIDEHWTADDQSAAEAKLRTMLPEGSTLRSFACRVSMCRIETTHQGARQYKSFTRTALMDPKKQLWNGGGLSMIVNKGAEGGEPLVALAFLARSGKELPSVE